MPENIYCGVQPICKVLQFAPSTYYASKARCRSARQIRDENIESEIVRVYENNYRVYGVRKIYFSLKREGFTAADAP